MSLDRLSDEGDKQRQSINDIVNRFCAFNSIYDLGMEPEFSVLWIGFLRNFSYMEENGKWKDGSWQTEKLYDTLKVVCDD
jgi:hypothetical protein